MESENTTPGAEQDLAQLVRSIYLERSQGAIEIRHSGGTESLFFRRGELYLDRDHDVAMRISPFLADLGEGNRPAAIPELRHELEKLARGLCRLRERKAETKDDRSMVVEMVGPAPTVSFLLELAVYGCDEGELIAVSAARASVSAVATARRLCSSCRFSGRRWRGYWWRWSSRPPPRNSCAVPAAIASR